jgi:hypothetical protein
MEKPPRHQLQILVHAVWSRNNPTLMELLYPPITTLN